MGSPSTQKHVYDTRIEALLGVSYISMGGLVRQEFHPSSSLYKKVLQFICPLNMLEEDLLAAMWTATAIAIITHTESVRVFQVIFMKCMKSCGRKCPCFSIQSCLVKLINCYYIVTSHVLQKSFFTILLSVCQSKSVGCIFFTKLLLVLAYNTYIFLVQMIRAVTTSHASSVLKEEVEGAANFCLPNMANEGTGRSTPSPVAIHLSRSFSATRSSIMFAGVVVSASSQCQGK
ncbi:hypothetical protein Taro_037714 [Colocasia esculenta]|uniref:Uncharacterized protein n=1 Tax=Colocasia esculenta TaxID=4460 RepID=A0A843W6A8_COLES|nr:hypothetical protein [Colocasia esculenta]